MNLKDTLRRIAVLIAARVMPDENDATLTALEREADINDRRLRMIELRIRREFQGRNR